MDISATCQYTDAVAKSIPIEGVSPSVLVWARERTGQGLEEAADRCNIKAKQLRVWEEGRGFPSYPQLEKLAKAYKRPIAIFFFPAPPEEPTPKEKFRTLPNTFLDNLHSDTLLALRRGYALQLALMELTNKRNPNDSPIFRKLAWPKPTAARELAEQVRDFLSISLETQFSWHDADEAFKAWRATVEDAGIFVFKRPFKQPKISGFCLIHSEFPIIMINNGTSKTRQVFTLFHELAHVLLGENNLMAGAERETELVFFGQEKIESFCNDFAGEFLVPNNDLENRLSTLEFSTDSVHHLAQDYNVSREVILRRLLEVDFLKPTQFVKQTAALYEEYEAERRIAQATKSSGGDYYANQRAYLGDRFLELAIQARLRGSASLDQVADYLGLTPATAAKLEDYWIEKISTT